MTSANDKNTETHIDDSQPDNKAAEKQNSLLSGIIAVSYTHLRAHET